MSTTAPTPAELKRAWLEERIKQHKAEVARWRAEHGDQDEALNRWVQENFTREALLYARQFVDGLSEQGNEDADAW